MVRVRQLLGVRRLAAQLRPAAARSEPLVRPDRLPAGRRAYLRLSRRHPDRRRRRHRGRPEPLSFIRRRSITNDIIYKCNGTKWNAVFPPPTLESRRTATSNFVYGNPNQQGLMPHCTVHPPLIFHFNHWLCCMVLVQPGVILHGGISEFQENCDRIILYC